MVIVASCEKQSDVMESFNRLFREKFVIKNPEKQDREEIIRWLLENDEKLATLGEEASRSLDAEAIGKYLQGKCFKEIRSILVKITRGVEKLENAQETVIKRLAQLEKDRRSFGEKAVRIPEVKWADVGGLASAKEDIL